MTGTGSAAGDVPGQAGRDWLPSAGGAGQGPAHDYSDPVPQAPGEQQDPDAISGGDFDNDDLRADENADLDASGDTGGFGFSWPLAALISIGLLSLALIAFVVGRRSEDR
ncbi:hypothetical protein [Brevibacterium ihuae]|uniref:hypothetical protein n=1 Tax=Brevibacterium ihuae TaxID=1631743 RepID=UPI000C790D33|nr:hypothetical protein [Brevibacterium ihuae]